MSEAARRLVELLARALARQAAVVHRMKREGTGDYAAGPAVEQVRRVRAEQRERAP